MAMHGSVPTHLQERQMKEAVMMDARPNKQSGHHIQTQKMMSDNVLAASMTYTSAGTSGAFQSQMKSHQSNVSKKASRMDNNSIGPTSKFKSSAKVSHLTSQAVNIKHVYGYGGGVLSNSNQSVQLKSHIPMSQKLNSTSMVRQNTQLVVQSNS